MLIVGGKLQSYLIQINQGTLDPAMLVQLILPKRVGLYLKFLLAPSANLEFNLKMMFINPFGKPITIDLSTTRG